MGLKRTLRKLFGSNQVKSASDAVVARLKLIEFQEGTLADAIADSIHAQMNSGKSNAEKFETVVNEFAPVIMRYVASGGIPAAVSDLASAARDLTRQVTQSVFNETAVKSGVQMLIDALAKRFGLKL